MKPEGVQVDERGFWIFDRWPDADGAWIKVKESSSWGMKHVRIFVDPEARAGAPESYGTLHICGIHLNVEGAKRLINALERFVASREGR